MSESTDSSNRSGRALRSSKFKYYIHDGVAACRLQLLGELTETELMELKGCWRTAKTMLGSRPVILDVSLLESVDEAGKRWLAGMAQEGAVCSPDNFLRDLEAGRHIAGAQTTAPLPKPGLFSRIMNLFRGTDVAAAK